MKRVATIGAALALFVGACAGDDAPDATTGSPGTSTAGSSAPADAPSNEVADPTASESGAGSITPTTSLPPDRSEDLDGVQPVGFTTATVRITEADGTTCEVCMWLADDGAERGRGLMGVTDLGDARGMAFVFERPTSGPFFMFQTITPLSIAWFDPSGALAATADMAPCESDDAAPCPRYSPGATYDVAIEVFRGDLASIGIEPGSTAEVLLDTEAPTCPPA